MSTTGCICNDDLSNLIKAGEVTDLKQLNPHILTTTTSAPNINSNYLNRHPDTPACFKSEEEERIAQLYHLTKTIPKQENKPAEIIWNFPTKTDESITFYSISLTDNINKTSKFYAMKEVKTANGKLKAVEVRGPSIRNYILLTPLDTPVNIAQKVGNPDHDEKLYAISYPTQYYNLMQYLTNRVQDKAFAALLLAKYNATCAPSYELEDICKMHKYETDFKN
jgi:hypothetical protein